MTHAYKRYDAEFLRYSHEMRKQLLDRYGEKKFRELDADGEIDAQVSESWDNRF